MATDPVPRKLSPGPRSIPRKGHPRRLGVGTVRGGRGEGNWIPEARGLGETASRREIIVTAATRLGRDVASNRVHTGAGLCGLHAAVAAVVSVVGRSVQDDATDIAEAQNGVVHQRGGRPRQRHIAGGAMA